MRATIDVVLRTYPIDFKAIFSLRNLILIFMLLLLQYYLSDETKIGYIKQLLGWVIVPFLTGLLKKKR